MLQDCAFSDAHQHLATGIVDGTLRLYTYSFADGSTGALSSDLRSTLRLSEASCRAVGFSADGSSIVAGYEDGLLALSSVETSQPILRLPDAHEAPISTLRVLDDNLMAVGDEAGCIQLWDLRSKAAVYTYSEHTDFITDFTVHQKDNCLVATSGDGTLSIHDLSKRKVGAAWQAVRHCNISRSGSACIYRHPLQQGLLHQRLMAQSKYAATVCAGARKV